MPKINFLQKDGSSVSVDATVGQTLMLAATAAGVDGVVAECGGSCMCATCHVYIEDGESYGLGTLGDLEENMLDLEGVDVTNKSRLSCQIEITEKMDGLTVKVAG